MTVGVGGNHGLQLGALLLVRSLQLQVQDLHANVFPAMISEVLRVGLQCCEDFLICCVVLLHLRDLPTSDVHGHHHGFPNFALYRVELTAICVHGKLFDERFMGHHRGLRPGHLPDQNLEV